MSDEEYGLIMNKKSIIVDIDGTLADISVRRKHLEGRKDWNSFNSNISRDVLNTWCREIIVRMSPDYSILLVSGRVDSLRAETINWLNENEVPFDALLMRKSNDFRSDIIIKEEIFMNEILGSYEVLFVIDDRSSIVDMWRRNGLVCLQCDVGNF